MTFTSNKGNFTELTTQKLYFQQAYSIFKKTQTTSQSLQLIELEQTPHKRLSLGKLHCNSKLNGLLVSNKCENVLRATCTNTDEEKQHATFSMGPILKDLIHHKIFARLLFLHPFPRRADRGKSYTQTLHFTSETH